METAWDQILTQLPDCLSPSSRTTESFDSCEKFFLRTLVKNKPPLVHSSLKAAVNNCSSNRNSRGHIFLQLLMYSLSFLKFGMTPDENISTFFDLFLYGKLVCVSINGSYWNLSCYKFIDISVIIVSLERHILESLLRSPLEFRNSCCKHLSCLILSGKLIWSCFLLLCPGNLNSLCRKEKRRWSGIDRMKYCAENCDWALQETFVWLKHLRIRALFLFLIYSDSSGHSVTCFACTTRAFLFVILHVVEETLLRECRCASSFLED